MSKYGEDLTPEEIEEDELEMEEVAEDMMTDDERYDKQISLGGLM